MPSTTSSKRPSWSPGRARQRSSATRAASQQAAAEEEAAAQVPYRGIRAEDVVMFELPPEKLAEDFRRSVCEATAASQLGHGSASLSASGSSPDGCAPGRMWYIGHVTRVDEDAVELSRSNPHFELAEVRQEALQSKVAATELALDEVVTRRRQVEDRYLNLERARAAVSLISPAEVHELQSYQHPPAGVRRVLEAVLTILGSPVATIAGWPSIRTAVRDPHFLDEVNSFAADSMSMERREELRARYEQDPLLLSESSGMLAVSVATRTLRTWVNAQLLYDGLDSNPYHIRGGADVVRLDSRAHALEEDLRVFYQLLHGEPGPNEGPAAPPRRPSKVEQLPAWPTLAAPAERMRVPYSWLVCRLDPPVKTRTDILPSERQFIDELWGYRTQDPPPSPQDFALSVDGEPLSERLDGSESERDAMADGEDEYATAAHRALMTGLGEEDEEEAEQDGDGLGEPVQVSCAHEDDDDDDDAAVEALVDHAAMRKQKAQASSEAADRYAYVPSTSSAHDS